MFFLRALATTYPLVEVKVCRPCRAFWTERRRKSAAERYLTATANSGLKAWFESNTVTGMDEK